MPTIAQAYVQVMPSADGIKGSLTSVLGGEADKAGTSAGLGIASKIKGAIIKAGIGAAIAKTVSASIEAGSALQQSFGGLDTIYGDASEAAKQYAYEAQKAGISANDYAEQAVSFGASLKQAFGGDTTKAVEAANTAIMDMTDNAAKMGTPIEQIQTAYQGFAKQNYTMLDNLKLGYGGTKEEMQRLLADAQELSGVEYDISNLGDVYDAIHVIQEDLGLTGVAAKEASETFSGSFGAMKAAAQNLLANLALGEDIKGPLKTLLSSVGTFLIGNLLPMIANVAKGIPTIIGTAFTQLTGALPSIAQGAASVISSFAQSIGESLPQLIPAALNMIATFSQNLRTGAGLIIDAGLELIRNLVTGLISGIPAFITSVPTIIENFAGIINDSAPKVIQAGFELIVKLGQGIIDAIPVFIANLPQIFSAALAVWQAFDWMSLGRSAISLIGNGITALVTHIPQLLRNIGSTAMNLFRSINWAGVGHTVITLIRSGITALITAIPQLLRTIGTNAMNLFRSINWASVGRAVINFIRSGVTALASAIPNALKSIGSRAMSSFKSINWASVGSAIINGIINGIRNLAGSLLATVRNVASSALSAIKGFFGIHSPSTVMRDQVGAMMALGIAEGFEEGLPVKEMVGETRALADGLADAATLNTAGGTVRTSSENATLDAILELLSESMPELRNRAVVLDSDKLVGALTPGIDRRLGISMGW